MLKRWFELRRIRSELSYAQIQFTIVIALGDVGRSQRLKRVLEDLQFKLTTI